MLQIDKSPSVQVENGRTTADISLAQQLSAFIGLVHRQYPIVLSVALVIIGLALSYLWTTAPLYTGRATLIIDTGKVKLLQQQSVLGDSPIDAGMVESQVEILKSESIALSVIKDLHLTQDPEFNGSGGGLIGTLIGLSMSNQPKSDFQLTRGALGVFQNRLGIRRVGLTYVIEISFTSVDPNHAAQIANAVADAYIVDQLNAKYQVTRRAAVWLQARLKELQTQASAAELAVVDYKSKNNIVDTGGPGNRLMNQQQITELNSGLMQARATTAEAQARLDRVSQILRNKDLDPAAADTATVADTLHDSVITSLRQKYLEIAQREADWSARYGPNHLAVVNLRNQMSEIRHSIADELQQIAETYKSDYDIARAREDSVQKSLDATISSSETTNKAQIELHALESGAQTYRTLYDNFLQRYMESVQQESFPITEARVITQATRPLGASSPKSLLVMAVASVGGLMLGLGLGMFRDISDRVFRTGSQVEDLLKTECIAIVPTLKADSLESTIADVDDNVVNSKIIHPTGLFRYVIDSPLSRFTESIRAVKVSADLHNVTKSGRVIGTTSSLPNEGKSTIAASLAQLCAHGGATAILVDCDLRRPSLSRKLAPNASLGLIDVIKGTATLDQVMWFDPLTRLSFLPAVTRPRLIHTNEILASEAMKRLFDQLRDRYDYVIADLSPISPVVDVRSTTQFIDSYFLVIEWGKTKIEIVEHALNTARGVYDNILGAILNKADLNLLNRYEHHRGKYNYNRYYAGYGYTIDE